MGYVRVSTVDQAEHGISLELQRHRIRLYAESRGLALHPIIFGDEGVSGRRQHNRRGLAEAVAFAVTRKAVLIVYSLSRFARSTRDCIELSEQLAMAGADLISLNESIDTSSAHGRFFFTLLAALAQLESDTMSDRLRAVFAHKRAKRELCGGFLPWGQRRSADGKHVEDDPAEIAALDSIIAARTSGLCWRDVARHVTEMGVRNRRGAPFSESNLVRLYKRHGPARGAPTEVYVAGLRERRAAGLASGRESRRRKLAEMLPPPKTAPSGKGPAADRQRAKIIGQVDDYRGTRHDVHAARPTSHGFHLMFGWPLAKRGRAKGPPAAIAHPPAGRPAARPHRRRGAFNPAGKQASSCPRATGPRHHPSHAHSRVVGRPSRRDRRDDPQGFRRSARRVAHCGATAGAANG